MSAPDACLAWYGRAVHVGHLDHDALGRLVGGARAALCTSLWEEPYGLVVAEALACGAPVAAFRRGGVPDILDPSCGVLAEPDGVDSLARAALAAARLPRASCWARAVACCDAERMVDAYEALYEEMIAGAPPGGGFLPTGPAAAIPIASAA